MGLGGVHDRGPGVVRNKTTAVRNKARGSWGRGNCEGAGGVCDGSWTCVGGRATLILIDGLLL